MKRIGFLVGLWLAVSAQGQAWKTISQEDQNFVSQTFFTTDTNPHINDPKMLAWTNRLEDIFLRALSPDEKERHQALTFEQAREALSNGACKLDQENQGKPQAAATWGPCYKNVSSPHT